MPHSLGTVSTESAARRYYKAIVEFESTLQGHEACDLTVSPYRVYPFPPLVYDGSIAYPRWEPNDRNRVRSKRGSPRKRVEHSKFLWNFGSYCSGTLVPIGQHICPIGIVALPEVFQLGSSTLPDLNATHSSSLMSDNPTENRTPVC